MTVQPVKDDTAYARPATFIPPARARGVRGSHISHLDKRLVPSRVPPFSTRNHRPAPSCYADEHRRMKPVMDLVRKTRLFEPISAGFRLYCTHRTSGLALAKRKFSGSRSLVIAVTWLWNHENEKIIGLEASLANTADLPWAREKIAELFKKAGMEMPPITLKER
jgi:hypothetical protein